MTKEQLQSPGALERLKTLAEKATQEGWEPVVHDDVFDCHPSIQFARGPQHPGVHNGSPFPMENEQAEADAKFIAATDPQTVLALIEMVEERDAVLQSFLIVGADSIQGTVTVQWNKWPVKIRGTLGDTLNSPKDGC